MFITTVTVIYSLGHGLCTLTAVPRPTQPSTLRGKVKWLSAYELSNNKMAMVSADDSSRSADSQPKSVGLVWGRPALSLHSSNEPCELSQWLCHDDSTINIVIVIIIVIIIWWTFLLSLAQQFAGTCLATSLNRSRQQRHTLEYCEWAAAVLSVSVIYYWKQNHLWFIIVRLNKNHLHVIFFFYSEVI